jgi:hypothetical protein
VTAWVERQDAERVSDADRMHVLDEGSGSLPIVRDHAQALTRRYAVTASEGVHRLEESRVSACHGEHRIPDVLTHLTNVDKRFVQPHAGRISGNGNPEIVVELRLRLLEKSRQPRTIIRL